MRDLDSNDVETAARLAAWDAWPDDDRPSLAELAEDEHPIRSGGYECVAKSVELAGDTCLTVSWWAREGSDWRPAWDRKPGELHVHIVSDTDAAGEAP